MSYSIAIDSNDYSADPQSNNNLISGCSRRAPSLNHNHPTVSHLITFISRLVYFRRLRLLKIYMAAMITILILFLIFYGSETSKSEVLDNDYGHSNLTKYSTDEHDKSINDLKFIPLKQASSIGSDQIEAAAGTSRSFSVTPKSKQLGYPTNFTYTLKASDFVHMKNVNMMQVKIREATKHSWDNYCKYAWGFDMLKPRARAPDNWFNLGLTIVDSADTLIIMGMTNEMNMALDWLENELKFQSENANSNCFEMTIRILAGLLSAYHLTGRDKLKQQAIEFGDILLHCYDTESGVIPYSDIDLSTRRAHPPQWNPHSSLSEVTSLQLEFRFLSQISGNPKYERTTFRTSEHIHDLASNARQKLLPMYINPSTGQLEESIITLGARSDSYYEYLLKQYLQTGIKWLETDYLDAMDEMAAKLVRHTDGPENYTYVAEMQVFRTINDTEELRYHNKMDHLVCFIPGTLALGYYHFSPRASEYRLRYNLEVPAEKLNSRYDYHLDLAKALARTCYHMYHNMGTGLSPEIASFVHSSSDDLSAQNQPEIQVPPNSAHNILRPEFVESLFYLYHITGLPMYRNQAEQIFEAFQKYSRIPSGYAAISDVRVKPPPNADLDEALHGDAPDRMESFWISETLKYLYLTFSEDKHVVGTILNNYVFNTEAHMFPIS